MAKQVQDFASDMAVEFGEVFTDTPVRDQYIAWTKEAFDRIVASGWFFTQNDEQALVPVASTRTYTLGTNVSEVRAIEIPGASAPISHEEVETLLRYGKNLSAEGTPTNWYIESLDQSTTAIVIALYPVPDAAFVAAHPSLTLHALIRRKELADSDNIPLPPDYLPVMMDFVRYRSRSRSNQADMALSHKQDFKEGLGLLNARYNKRPSPGSDLPAKVKPPRVGQMPAGGS